jgi:SnoaL-like polyketide cyclase
MARMSTEKNLALVSQAVMEIWNGLDLDLADRLFDPSYINHGGIIPDLLTGPESMKFGVVLQHTAFPRLQVQARSLVAEGDVVELKWVATAGYAPGRRARRIPVPIARGTTLIRCAHGRIAESWTTWDCPTQRDITDVRTGYSTARYRLTG